MRPQAKNTIIIRKKAFGGLKPLICAPLVEKDIYRLETEAKKIIKAVPDVIEWRADYFNDIYETEKVKSAIRMLRFVLGETPLIFTLRSHLEGGFQQIEQNVRYEIIEHAISTKEIDVVDIELISGKANVDRIKNAIHNKGIPLILSYHNFIETPDIEFLVDRIKQQILMGANIAKIAVMPKNEQDVLNLLSATLKVRKELPEYPLITMSMGRLGVISRIAGGLFGSDLTFGSGEKTSAPGQIPVNELKECMKVLYK